MTDIWAVPSAVCLSKCSKIIFLSFYLFFSFIYPIFAAKKKDEVMNTMIGTIPMDAMLTMLNSLSRRDRHWLIEQMREQVEREDAEAEKSFKELLERPSSWKEESDARLDAALARFHKDWGGDKSPLEIANELRQRAEMVKDVEVW